jgi:opacity protein-like surface antigen
MTKFSAIAFVAAVLLASAAPAADVKVPPPKCTLLDPAAPVGATARCRDGTYSFSQHQRAACSGHRGLEQWLMPTRLGGC